MITPDQNGAPIDSKTSTYYVPSQKSIERNAINAIIDKFVSSFESLDFNETDFIESYNKEHRDSVDLVQDFRCWYITVVDAEGVAMIGGDAYTYSLWVRSGLHDIALVAPANLRKKINEGLSTLDERFREHTIEIGRASLGREEEYPRGTYWWMYRIPKRMGPRLKEEMIASGQWPI